MNKKWFIIIGLSVTVFTVQCVDIKKKVQKGLKEVKKKVIDPVTGYFEKLDAWVSPDPRLRLDQTAFLASHNAHVNREEGFLYNQQIWNVNKQLDKGVRQLLLDIWKDKNELLLCHGTCSTISAAARVGRKHKSFKSSLETIKRFLDKHPNEIITIELESYVTGDETYNVIKSVPGLEQYILKHTDYEPLNYGGQWPTLKWLIDKNKRFIIFDTKDNKNYAFNTDVYMIRNMYGTHDLNKACTLRGKLRPNRTLYQLNYFGSVSSPLAIHNTPNQLQKVLTRCQKKGVVPFDKTPNFVAIDFVDRGNAMKWINALNKKAARDLK